MTRRAPTIVDLARDLGLSKTTVADALRGTGRVAEKTRERVLAAAKRSGYVANSSARGLKKRQRGFIGLYVPEDIRHMQFYMEFTFGAVNAADKFGFDLIVTTTLPDDPTNWQILHGAIVIDALADDPLLMTLIQSGIPLVSAGKPSGDLVGRFTSSVAIEHADECQRLLDALGESGVKYPVFIGASLRDDTSWTSQVRDGYVSWMQRRNLKPCFITLPPFVSNEELSDALENVLKKNEVDALLFGWQDAAERAQLILAREEYSNRDLKVAAYTSRSTPDKLAGFDATLNLEPYIFGQHAVALLADSNLRHPVAEAERHIPTLTVA